jgi:hypothetical protein
MVTGLECNNVAISNAKLRAHRTDYNRFIPNGAITGSALVGVVKSPASD